MYLIDIVRYAVGIMMRRKFRTALTSMGVAVGIAAIVALLSITQGLQASVQAELRDGLGTDTLTIFPDGAPLLISDAAGLEDLDHVSIAAPIVQRAGRLGNGNGGLDVNIVGTDLVKYQAIFRSVFVTQIGTVPGAGDGIVIGARVYDPGGDGTILFPHRSAATVTKLGEDGTYDSTIAGVLNTIGPLSIGAISDSSIYIPIERAAAFYGTDVCESIIVKLDDDRPSTIEAATKAVEDRFGGQVKISSPKVIGTVVSRVFSTINLFLLGVAGITLLVAGIGIMSTMTIALYERTREIGTLKSLGFKDRTVLGIFLSEAGIIGIAGGVVGVIAGFLMAGLISSFLNSGALQAWSGFSAYADITIVPEMDLMIAAGAVLFGVLISIVFSFYPAWRASRLSPVEALRHE